MQHLISIKAKIKRSNVNAFKGDFFFFNTKMHLTFRHLCITCCKSLYTFHPYNNTSCYP